MDLGYQDAKVTINNGIMHICFLSIGSDQNGCEQLKSKSKKSHRLSGVRAGIAFSSRAYPSLRLNGSSAILFALFLSQLSLKH
jgi:hypothetical protein